VAGDYVGLLKYLFERVTTTVFILKDGKPFSPEISIITDVEIKMNKELGVDTIYYHEKI